MAPAGGAKRGGVKHDFRLGSVFGLEIRIDFSWFVIFFLVFWTLSKGIFPEEFPELPTRTHAAMGLVGTLLFFTSLVIHELSHALVSRAKSVPVEGITLFIFGGVARLKKEPETPQDEMMIAGIGPVTSFGLAALFMGIARGAEQIGLGDAVTGVADYLAFINLALAIFNLMPGFPLDGGRVFRAIVWAVTGNRTKATRWASRGGQTFGLLLIILGAMQALGGAPLGGLWLVFIGWFLRSLAGMSLQQHVLQDLMRGYVATDLMSKDPAVVSPRLHLDELLQEHFMRLRFGCYPVVEDGVALGLVTLDDIKRVPRDRWQSATVADAMTPRAECATLSADASVAEILEEMRERGGRRRALVEDGTRLVGVISASDIALWVGRVQGIEDLVAGS